MVQKMGFKYLKDSARVNKTYEKLKEGVKICFHDFTPVYISRIYCIVNVNVKYILNY